VRTALATGTTQAIVTRIARVAVVGAIAAWLAPACSLGAGTGTCSGTLDVVDCWAGQFDLNPDFFAAVPTSNTNIDALQLRIQHGADNQTFADGLIISVDDVGEVRGDPESNGTPRPSLLGMPLVVALPAGVSPPGVPLTARSQQAIVHAQLYLNATCRTQNDALYAVDAVSTNADGSCDRPSGGDPSMQCGGGGVASTVRGSTITFNAVFDGNPDEGNTAQLLTDASFHFYLADPREICPGGMGPPPRCRGELTGTFHFYFERGRPAQPFP
jgi:hypothetical protein